jgi:hypothetical protein
MKKLGLLAGTAVMVAVFAMSASAADWNFYGSARVQTFYTDTDNKNGVEDTINYGQSLQSNARIGANVKVSDELIGRFEYGASGGNANIRHLYGEWDFGSGKLLVGQTDSPLNMSLSNQVYGNDTNLDPYGHVDAKRQPMIRLNFGGFQIAAIQPNTDTWDGGVADSTTEVIVPKLEASYRLVLDNAFLDFQGGYQTYEITDTATNISNDVDSYILAVGGQIKFDSFYFGANLWLGQNTGPYNYNCAADDDPTFDGSTLVENDSLGYALVGGMKLNETFSFELGYGYTEAELDQAGANKDAADSYYVQSTVTLAPGVFFVPEIGVIDNKKDKAGIEESEILYYGIKWQINF